MTAMAVLARYPHTCRPESLSSFVGLSSLIKHIFTHQQPMSTPPLHDPLAPPVADAKIEVRNTTCYMCACRCGIRVHLRNGEVRYIDGNPNHPLNNGVICAKGSSGIMKQYSPARLTKPLRRKQGSERGAGEFVETTWEEAYALLAERLGRIRSTDPKKFA